MDLDTVTCAEVSGFFRTIEDNSIDAIITDPPYPKEFLFTYEVLAREASRVLKPGGSCLAMCGETWIPNIMASMGAYLNYHWMIAYMTPGETAQQWHVKVNAFWKPILWHVKGVYTGPWVGDVIWSPKNDKQHHFWGQSEGGIYELVRRFTKRGDIVCDPFVGGGTTAVIAKRMGRHYICGDLLESNVAKTIDRLNAAYTLPMFEDVPVETPAEQLTFNLTDGG